MAAVEVEGTAAGPISVEAAVDSTVAAECVPVVDSMVAVAASAVVQYMPDHGSVARPISAAGAASARDRTCRVHMFPVQSRSRALTAADR